MLSPLKKTADIAARNRRVSGIGLIECLVVILIIVVITSIALPRLAHLKDGPVAYVKDHPNAQMLATICTAAAVVGLDLIVEGDLVATLEKIAAGGEVGEGQLAGTRFSLPGLNEQDRAGALPYLSLEDGRLTYRPEL
ncbi:MAG: hypothetical protein ACC661_03255 [Verrucomicrobiales bacterium]